MNTYLQECPNDILTNKEKKHFMNSRILYWRSELNNSMKKQRWKYPIYSWFYQLCLPCKQR
jgi:hypothetical protein